MNKYFDPITAVVKKQLRKKDAVIPDKTRALFYRGKWFSYELLVDTKKFVQLPEWHELREHIRNTQVGWCYLGQHYITHNCNIDHVKPRKHFPWLAFDPKNLLKTCGSCHSKKLNNYFDESQL